VGNYCHQISLNPWIFKICHTIEFYPRYASNVPEWLMKSVDHRYQNMIKKLTIRSDLKYKQPFITVLFNA